MAHSWRFKDVEINYVLINGQKFSEILRPDQMKIENYHNLADVKKNTLTGRRLRKMNGVFMTFPT